MVTKNAISALSAYALSSSSDDDPSVDILYHYTSLDSFIKIMDSGVIHMTSMLYMNDSKEYYHGLEIIKQQINDLIGNEEFLKIYFADRSQVFFSKLKSSFQEIIIDNLELQEVYKEGRKDEYGKIFDESIPYVFSLSTARDDLSQWRAYSGQSGVAIGFNKKYFSSLTKCLYCVEDQKNKVKEAIAKILQMVSQQSKNFADDQGDEGNYQRQTPSGLISKQICTVPGMIEHDDKVFQAINKLIPKFKHVAFESEKEWRYILKSTSERKAKYKLKGSMLVPYLEVPLQEICNQAKLKDIISEIWIFPETLENDLFRRSFDAYIGEKLSITKEEPLNKGKILYSKTPYRAS